MHENRVNMRRNTRTCFQCGKPGHFVANRPEKVENKDNYKHKLKTDGKYRSRRDHKHKHKHKHKRKHKDERRSRQKESRGNARAMVGASNVDSSSAYSTSSSSSSEDEGVNTKNWYREETDLWAEFGRRAPFGKRFSSKHLVKTSAVGSTSSFGRRAVSRLEEEAFGNA
jgi:hypothetical protein